MVEAEQGNLSLAVHGHQVSKKVGMILTQDKIDDISNIKSLLG